MAIKKLHTHVECGQSAAIPFRWRDGRIEVLLITSKGSGRWIVPKGSIEEELGATRSAQKEAYEEAGVTGNVHAVSLGCYEHGESDPKLVEVFLLEVTTELEEYPESDERKRRWIPIEEAYGYLDDDGLKSILDEALQIISRSESL